MAWCCPLQDGKPFIRLWFRTEKALFKRFWSLRQHLFIWVHHFLKGWAPPQSSRWSGRWEQRRPGFRFRFAAESSTWTGREGAAAFGCLGWGGLLSSGGIASWKRDLRSVPQEERCQSSFWSVAFSASDLSSGLFGISLSTVGSRRPLLWQ